MKVQVQFSPLQLTKRFFLLCHNFRLEWNMPVSFWTLGLPHPINPELTCRIFRSSHSKNIYRFYIIFFKFILCCYLEFWTDSWLLKLSVHQIILCFIFIYNNFLIIIYFTIFLKFCTLYDSFYYFVLYMIINFLIIFYYYYFFNNFLNYFKQLLIFF